MRFKTQLTHLQLIKPCILLPLYQGISALGQGDNLTLRSTTWKVWEVELS